MAPRGSLSGTERGTMRRRLIRWFARNRRALPWRERATPYRVWVSEVMLQQTQAATVVPYFERFVRRFPGVAALAAADLDEVLALWAGLGYYGRARNLHRAARMLMDGSAAGRAEPQAGGAPGAKARPGKPQRRGEVPDTLDGLLALPGVGRYTAGAILSIAFNRPAPILDGNVTRVLCRLFAIGGDPKGSANQRRLWRLAEQLVDPGDPSAFNQGLMELGATVCVPASPRCGRCPLKALCRARRLGRVGAFPAPSRAAAVRAERWAAARIERDGALLLVRRSETGRWGGLWEFPSVLVGEGDDPKRSVRTHLRRSLGLTGLRFKPLGTVGHQLSHRALTVEVFAARAESGTVRTGAAVRWVGAEPGLDEIGVSRLTRKIASLSPSPL